MTTNTNRLIHRLIEAAEHWQAQTPHKPSSLGLSVDAGPAERAAWAALADARHYLHQHLPNETEQAGDDHP